MFLPDDDREARAIDVFVEQPDEPLLLFDHAQQCAERRNRDAAVFARLVEQRRGAVDEERRLFRQLFETALRQLQGARAQAHRQACARGAAAPSPRGGCARAACPKIRCSGSSPPDAAPASRFPRRRRSLSATPVRRPPRRRRAPWSRSAGRTRSRSGCHPVVIGSANATRRDARDSTCETAASTSSARAGVPASRRSCASTAAPLRTERGCGEQLIDVETIAAICGDAAGGRVRLLQVSELFQFGERVPDRGRRDVSPDTSPAAPNQRARPCRCIRRRVRPESAPLWVKAVTWWISSRLSEC